MQSFTRFIAFTGVLVSVIGTASAQAQTATQDVGYTVSSIDEISVSGTPSLTISSAVAGSAPTDATFTTSSYSITTNNTNRKITAEIDLAMPAGLTLKADLAAPAGATSAGAVTLSATAADVVTGISSLNQSGLNLTYSLSATSAAAPQSGTRTVTYTVIEGV